MSTTALQKSPVSPPVNSSAINTASSTVAIIPTRSSATCGKRSVTAIAGGEIRNRRKDGSYYWVDTVITPVRDQEGRIYQYLSVRNLITLQKENEEKLVQMQEAYRKQGSN